MDNETTVRKPSATQMSVSASSVHRLEGTRGGEGKARTVLVVDDEAPMRDYLHDVLSQDGYHCKCFSDGFELFSYLGEEGGQGDLVLTDISMPGLSGIELLRAAHTVEPDLPVILISGMYELALALDALNAGAADYLLKPALPRDVLGLVKKHLQPVDDSQQSIAREELRRHLNKHQGGQGVADFLQDLHEALEFKRYETLQHCKRVAAYSDLIGRACGLGESELSDLQTGSLLHDIGKVAIPRNVLVKPGSLNDEERTAMCLHPQIGWEMLSEYPELQPAAEIVYTHHERFDGKGYPRGLRAAAIPLGARIFSIVDAFDAITSNRPYRAAQPIEQARAEIEKRSGTQFDPEFVGVFLQLPRKELQVIHERYQDGTDGLGT